MKVTQKPEVRGWVGSPPALTAAMLAAIILGLTALAVALTHTRIASRFVASYSALCRRVFDAIANAARDPGGRRDTVGA